MVRLRRRNPRLGQDMLRALLARRGVQRSTATVRRILHAHGLSTRCPTRWQRRRLATEIRTTMRAFEKLQVDITHLDDIPALLPAVQAQLLPGYEYTAKDVATGIAFVCSGLRALGDQLPALCPPALPAPSPPRRRGSHPITRTRKVRHVLTRYVLARRSWPRGSSRSRSPSPMKLKESTVRQMASPGRVDIHQPS